MCAFFIFIFIFYFIFIYWYYGVGVIWCYHTSFPPVAQT